LAGAKGGTVPASFGVAFRVPGHPGSSIQIQTPGGTLHPVHIESSSDLPIDAHARSLLWKRIHGEQGIVIFGIIFKNLGSDKGRYTNTFIPI